jgi:hypothetical protein
MKHGIRLLGILGVIGAVVGCSVKTDNLSDQPITIDQSKADVVVKASEDQVSKLVAEAKGQIERIEKSGKLDEKSKEFIQRSLAAGDEAAHKAAMPVIHAALQRVPDQKDWLLSQLQKKAEQAGSAAKQTWNDALGTAKVWAKGALSSDPPPKPDKP